MKKACEWNLVSRASGRFAEDRLAHEEVRAEVVITLRLLQVVLHRQRQHRCAGLCD